MVKRTQITVNGTVQGVGFRPYVYNLAHACGLKGFVTNTSAGVKIEVEGEETESFMQRLLKNPPPLSHIDYINTSTLPTEGSSDFEILSSISDETSFTMLSPDISICEDCLREMFTPSDRRYLYPFINCSNCGPRYTITKAIPYDRANTTMSVFTMCGECRAEYESPGNRRFHAEPIACHSCGPKVALFPETGLSAHPLLKAVEYLKQGAILAVKGLGGYHLCCDALNEEALRRLRNKKRRDKKPFAMMSPDITAIEEFAHVSAREREMLLSPQRAVVLLKKKGGIPHGVSSRSPSYGFMLPYTPLHYLLFHYPCTAAVENTFFPPAQYNFKALVMTSGNQPGEPIISDNGEAIKKLSTVADAFITHNRDIYMAIDDSVLSVRAEGTINLIRRARGFVPAPVMLSEDGPDTLALGGDIKNTFTVAKGCYAIPGPHTGDMEHIDTIEFFSLNLANIMSMYNIKPLVAACDMHPGYFSSEYVSGSTVVVKTAVQHHHAHFASVAAEHNLQGKAIGVVFDGTGYGTDNNLWGGEFLVADVYEFDRAAHFKYIPLPGGAQAVREPRRMAVSYIVDVYKENTMAVLQDLGFIERHGRQFTENLLRIIPQRQYSPLSSSAGRLFDAVAALLWLCDINTFEAEAAMALESVIDEDYSGSYPFSITTERFIDFSLTISKIIEDILNAVDTGRISASFHNTMVAVICEVVNRVSKERNIRNVVLSGGTFQNAFLVNKTVRALKETGMAVFVNERVPCNDGGLSLGQGYIARERLKNSEVI
ncbi:MAG: carbamoyltransferase HypF [Nitrospirae bacterium YQR-1]